MESRDYLRRVYGGWLGKCAGVRHGAPVEGWTAQEIERVYGKGTEGFVPFLQRCDIFEADDDINGPYFLARAMADENAYADVTSEQISRAWLNYPPFEHGFFWWPGYGRPTAYHLLYAGAKPWEEEGMPPDTGLGGRIFIDCFGLCCPGEPALAKKLAERALKVHCRAGGSGEDSAVLEACLISLAFTEKSAEALLEKSLAFIPPEGDIGRLARALLACRRGRPTDLQTALELINARFAAPKFPGMFNAVPNMAYLLLGLLFSEGNFLRALQITTSCGLDTDCNSGNLGVILGVLLGPEGIPLSMRESMRDIAVCSSVLGDENIGDIPTQAKKIALMGCRVMGFPPPKSLLRSVRLPLSLDFTIGGEYHGLWPLRGQKRDLNAVLLPGEHGLTAAFPALGASHTAALEYRTYLHPEDVHNSRYDPSFSPKVYPGQTLKAVIALQSLNTAVRGSVYARLRGGEIFESEQISLEKGVDTHLLLPLPCGLADLIEGVGVRVLQCGQTDETVRLRLSQLYAEGEPDYTLDFARETTEMWDFFHYELSQISYTRGRFFLKGGMLHAEAVGHGEMLSGAQSFQDYSLKTTVYLESGEARVLIRAQGAFRYYALSICGETARLILLDGFKREKVLAQTALKKAEAYPVTLGAKGSRITADIDGHILTAEDGALSRGAFGAGVAGAFARAAFTSFIIRGGNI